MPAATMSSQSPRNAQDLSISALLSPSAPDPSSIIRTLLHKHIDQAMQSLPPRRDDTDIGLITHIGDTIIHLQSMLSNIAEELVDDNFIMEKTESFFRGSADGGNMDDLMPLTHLNESYRALKEVRSKLGIGLSENTYSWVRAREKHFLRHEVPQLQTNFSPRSSFSTSNQTDSQYGARSGHQRTASVSSPVSIKPSPESSDSASSPGVKPEPPADYAMDIDMDIDMDSLKSRGKGMYKCKYGMGCTKGGVDRNGRIVIFERNCMFRQHMDKHEKPYRCDIDGCLNTDGFARKDQLERHKKNVHRREEKS